MPSFATRVVHWQRAHGRSHLPWQGTREPYRVWLSEVMLQQTQVTTVLGYYARFLERFPDVQALAAAPLDEVLAMWSGLGYYSRGRNLHACAREVVGRFGGEFPTNAVQLATLPGIGRSTAAAIAAFCFHERAAILDGNVKRVLARVLAFDADLAVATNQRALWELAQQLVPTKKVDMPAYTQGLMDLGATVCTARRPACSECPLLAACAGARSGEPKRFPVKTRRLVRGRETMWLLFARRRDGAVWLVRRPDVGVWAGLHCLPAFDTREALLAALPAAARSAAMDGPGVRHALTHKELLLRPVHAAVAARAFTGAGAGGGWYRAEQWVATGLPAPVRRLLEAAAANAPPAPDAA